VGNQEGIPETWERDIFLHDLDRTIRFANVRCLSRETIIAGALNLENDEDLLNAYLYRLNELTLTPSEQQTLATGMVDLAGKTEDTSTEVKSTADRLLLRLVRILPLELATHFAEPYLDHRRKTRRKWAYATLRDKPITGENIERVGRIFRRTGDKALLPFITRTPECVRMLGADFLLAKLAAKDQEYWRMRVLQAVLTYDRNAAIALSEQLPWEFTFAAGRTEDKTLVPAIQSLFEGNSDNGKFVSIYAWALGKLGARQELEALESFLRRKHPPRAE
jgi:hypothetical protein